MTNWSRTKGRSRRSRSYYGPYQFCENAWLGKTFEEEMVKERLV